MADFVSDAPGSEPLSVLNAWYEDALRSGETIPAPFVFTNVISSTAIYPLGTMRCMTSSGLFASPIEKC
jgi:hypothetical protein